MLFCVVSVYEDYCYDVEEDSNDSLLMLIKEGMSV